MAELTEYAPSELGTKRHWESVYEGELRNFEEFGDPGEVWYGESVAERLVEWIVERPDLSKESDVLEVGCGNGQLLCRLASSGFSRLRGMDYSERAISLAQALARSEGHPEVELFAADLFSMRLERPAELLVDKGTYDAILLSPPGELSFSNVTEAYAASIRRNCRPGGLFMITACNLTREELRQRFEAFFRLVETIDYPPFEFGGHSGATVATAVFRV